MAWLYRIIDLITPIAILALSSFIYGINWHERYTLLGIIGGIIFLAASQFLGLYRHAASQSLINSLQLIFNAWVITWVLLVVLAFLLKDSANFSRGTLIIWAIMTPLSIVVYRAILNQLYFVYASKENNIKKVAFIGSSLTQDQFAGISALSHHSPVYVTGFYDNTSSLNNSPIEKNRYIGDLEQAIQDAHQNFYDEVYICLPLYEENKIKEILDKLSDTAVTVKYIPNLFIFDLMHAKWGDINGIPVLSVYDSPLNSISARLVKRIEDVVLSFTILILITPILLLIAIGIKLSSPGPVIFKQKRYGLNGKEINVYKFRSMFSQDNGNEIKQATRNDSRITPFGAFLRKTSLDELPQFVNVIQGKMSIVGPRPHATAHNEEYRKLVPKYMQRHMVKPGITGWAQINGWRGETDTLQKMEKRVEFDLHYIKNWSLWLDTKIIILTVIKGFTGNNAY